MRSTPAMTGWQCESMNPGSTVRPSSATSRACGRACRVHGHHRAAGQNQVGGGHAVPRLRSLAAAGRAGNPARQPPNDQSGGSTWYISSVWYPARRFRQAWITYQAMPTSATIPTNVTPELLRYASTSPPPEMTLYNGPTPANQYRTRVKASQAAPI